MIPRALLALTIVLLMISPAGAVHFPKKPLRILPPVLPRCVFEPPPMGICHKPARYDRFTCACQIVA